MKLLKFLLFILVATLLQIASLQSAQLELPVTDDIWVYRLAGAPSTDPLLRCWGDGLTSIDDEYPPGHEFSYIYLKWALPENLTGNYNVTSAVLHLRHQPYPSYTQALGEQYPLEARTLGSGFSEATWLTSNPANPQPGAFLGNADLSQYATESAFPISINLLQSEGFEEHLNDALSADRKIAIALVSAMPAFGIVGSPIYRIYAKEAGGGIYAPKLSLTLEQNNHPVITIPESRNQAPGTQVRVSGIVTHASAADGAFWIQDSQTRAGIAIYPASPANLPVTGNVVTVTGSASVFNNAEAAISAAAWVSSSNTSPFQTAISVRHLGGLQAGLQPATQPSQTINTVGMLVKISGKVVGTGSASYWEYPVNTFVLTDGSETVEITTSGAAPAQGTTAIVTGVVRAVNQGSAVRAVIAASSIQTVAP